jgi:hypothetical protein
VRVLVRHKEALAWAGRSDGPGRVMWMRLSVPTALASIAALSGRDQRVRPVAQPPQHLESDAGDQDGEEPESFAPQHEAPSGRPF